MLLLPLNTVIELIGFGSPTSTLYKMSNSSEFEFKFSERTFSDVLKGKKKPSKAFIDNFNEFLSYSSGGEIIDVESFMDIDIDQYISPWVIAVSSWRKSISADMFPFTQKEILRIAEIEQSIVNECRLTDDFEYRNEIIFNNPFVQSILNKTELNDIRNSKSYNEFGKALFLISLKNSFYVLACLESEFIRANIDHFKSTESRITQYLLPIKKNGKVKCPLQRLFDYWSKKNKISFTAMAKVISGNVKETTTDTGRIHKQRRKFIKWRAGEHNPNSKDIENILLSFSPEMSESDLEIGMNIYRTALSLTKLFVELGKFGMCQDTDDLIAFFNNYTDVYADANKKLTCYLNDSTGPG
ncbi:MAG: hypothetical protein JEZ12_03720 [Desulfobacterium sp.]|nr:hypothetical protein [Desulfobacterium sp.]